MDTKKELVRPFKTNGRGREPRGEPVRVGTHDFPDRQLGRAVPYGSHDVAAKTGWVDVGTDHDTAAFAVESIRSIRRWWNAAGRDACPAAGRLLITADSGGSNGYRTRTCKTELAIVGSIATTTTKTGLRVHTELDTNPYPTGIQVSDDEIAVLPITRHRFHGDWNCTPSGRRRSVR